MTHSRLFHFSACFATLFALTNCGGTSASSTPSDATGGNTPNSSSTGGASAANPTGGASSVAGGNSTGGASAATSGAGTGGATTAVNTGTTGGSKPTGGATSAGGTAAAGGTKATGGATTGANTGTTGGTKATGGATTAGGTAAAGGTKATGGATAAGGVTAATGGAATTGGTTADANTDCKGQALAKPGDKTSTNGAYLNLGDMRLIDNMWGSNELSCSGTQMSVYVNSDKTLGWDFNRQHCDSAYSGAHPDYPEIEFGVAPFGTGTYASLLTTPSCSSTTVLPIQVKSISTASINFTNYSITGTNIGSCGETYDSLGKLQSWTCSWNLDWEFWLSQDNPNTNPNPTVVAEVIGFWGWEQNRWACDKTLTSSPTLNASGTTYKICHQSNQWHTTSPPQWSYYQFWDTTGPKSSFSGKIDIKAVLDWLKSNYSDKINDNLWLTRIEVGTEIDDNTVGKTSLGNVAFEINGTSKTPQFGQ